MNSKLPDVPVKKAPSRVFTSDQDQSLKDLWKASMSANTQRTYKSALKRFIAKGGVLPAEEFDVLSYIINSKDSLNERSIALHLTAISRWHFYHEFKDPVKTPRVAQAMKGLNRTKQTPVQRAEPLSPVDIKSLLEHFETIKDPARRARNRALFLIAYLGGFRRSELVGIQVEHLSFVDKGVKINIPNSKTDQEGKGKDRGIVFTGGSSCGVTALKQWLFASGISSGYIFRGINRWGKISENPMNAGSINAMLKQLAKESGIDCYSRLSSHSFRRGMATSASDAKVPFKQIKKQGGWASDASVSIYNDEGSLLNDNASSVLSALIDRC